MRATRRRKAIHALAVFLIFSVAQVYIQMSLAKPGGKVKEGSVLLPAQDSGPLTGKLTTKDNQPILVNGVSLSSGGTILSGSTIDVPDGVGATIDLGPLGQLDLAPNTKVVVEYNNGEVKVKLIQGCAILRTKKGIGGELKTEQGEGATNDREKGGVADVCFPVGAPSPIVNAGAAAQAGAGALGGAAAGGGGLEAVTYLLIFGGGGGAAAAIALSQGGGNANQGGNPSGSSPF